MGTDNTENTAVIEEETEVTGDDVSEESKPSETDKVTSSEPEEGEKTTKDEGKWEETIEQKVERLAQSKADKANVTLQKRNFILEQRNKEVSLLLYDKASANLFDEEQANLDEDDAKKRKSMRDAARKDFADFKENEFKIKQSLNVLGVPDINSLQSFLENTKSKNVMEGINKVEAVIRDYQYKEKVWDLIFGEDKKKIEQVNKYLDKFKGVQYQEDAEIIFESIKESLKGKPFKADSGRESGGGGKLTLKQIQNMTPDEKIEKNAEILAFFDKQEA